MKSVLVFVGATVLCGCGGAVSEGAGNTAGASNASGTNGTAGANNAATSNMPGAGVSGTAGTASGVGGGGAMPDGPGASNSAGAAAAPGSNAGGASGEPPPPAAGGAAPSEQSCEELEAAFMAAKQAAEACESLENCTQPYELPTWCPLLANASGDVAAVQQAYDAWYSSACLNVRGGCNIGGNEPACFDGACMLIRVEPRGGGPLPLP